LAVWIGLYGLEDRFTAIRRHKCQQLALIGQIKRIKTE
jgi:hypothetical protein